MESVRKALWLMEGRFGNEVSLDELSQAAGISRCHFAHVFARATGQSAMRYMRGRRLSEAARVLANRGPRHPDRRFGFRLWLPRSFRPGVPRPIRMTRRGSCARPCRNVNLVEVIKMDDGPIATLTPPRISNGGCC